MDNFYEFVSFVRGFCPFSFFGMVLGYSVWMAGVENAFFTTVMICSVSFLWLLYVLSLVAGGNKRAYIFRMGGNISDLLTATGCYYLFSASMSLLCLV